MVAARAFVQRRSTGQPLGVLFFNDDVIIRLPPTTDQASIRRCTREGATARPRTPIFTTRSNGQGRCSRRAESRTARSCSFPTVRTSAARSIGRPRSMPAVKGCAGTRIRDRPALAGSSTHPPFRILPTRPRGTTAKRRRRPHSVRSTANSATRWLTSTSPIPLARRPGRRDPRGGSGVDGISRSRPGTSYTTPALAEAAASPEPSGWIVHPGPRSH